MSVKRYYDADGADGDALGVHGYTANVSNVYVFDHIRINNIDTDLCVYLFSMERLSFEWEADANGCNGDAFGLCRKSRYVGIMYLYLK